MVSAVKLRGGGVSCSDICTATSSLVRLAFAAIASSAMIDAGCAEARKVCELFDLACRHTSLLLSSAASPSAESLHLSGCIPGSLVSFLQAAPRSKKPAGRVCWASVRTLWQATGAAAPQECLILSQNRNRVCVSRAVPRMRTCERAATKTNKLPPRTGGKASAHVKRWSATTARRSSAAAPTEVQ